MATNIFLGYPPENIKKFIEENYVNKEEEDYNGPLCFTANEPNSSIVLNLLDNDDIYDGPSWLYL